VTPGASRTQMTYPGNEVWRAIPDTRLPDERKERDTLGCLLITIFIWIIDICRVESRTSGTQASVRKAGEKERGRIRGIMPGEIDVQAGSWSVPNGSDRPGRQQPDGGTPGAWATGTSNTRARTRSPGIQASRAGAVR